jgi:glycine reductase
MTEPLRVVHYLNQFFAGIGGGSAPPSASDASRAGRAGRALQAASAMPRGVGTVICGDNHVAEQEEAVAAIRAELETLRPDVVVAGPAFGSGRYGLACAAACRAAAALWVPAVTGMHPDNPAVEANRQRVLIVPAAESATGMQPAVASLAPRCAWRGEDLGPPSSRLCRPGQAPRLGSRARDTSARSTCCSTSFHGRPS